jgi:hypothetical protein
VQTAAAGSFSNSLLKPQDAEANVNTRSMSFLGGFSSGRAAPSKNFLVKSLAKCGMDGDLDCTIVYVMPFLLAHSMSVTFPVDTPATSNSPTWQFQKAKCWAIDPVILTPRMCAFNSNKRVLLNPSATRKESSRAT